MPHLTADDTPLLILGGIVEPAEIYDGEGKLLGVFVPDNLAKTRELYAKTAALFDPAELERTATTGQKGYTTKEVFEHLLSLTEDEPTRAHLRELIEDQENSELMEQVLALLQHEPARAQLRDLVNQYAEKGACATR